MLQKHDDIGSWELGPMHEGRDNGADKVDHCHCLCSVSPGAYLHIETGHYQSILQLVFAEHLETNYCHKTHCNNVL
jgi:hypothetical protein